MEFNSTPESEMAEQERFNDWLDNRENNAVSNIINSELGLLKTVLTAGSIENLKDHIFWRMNSFLDEDEAKDWVDCYHEARDLGMSIDWVLDSVFALCSANRKIGRTNVISAVMDTLSGSKRDYMTYNPKDSKSGGKDSDRGPVNG